MELCMWDMVQWVKKHPPDSIFLNGSEFQQINVREECEVGRCSGRGRSRARRGRGGRATVGGEREWGGGEKKEDKEMLMKEKEENMINRVADLFLRESDSYLTDYFK
jgi:hypothetical protein